MARNNVLQNPFLLIPFKYGIVGGILSILLLFILLWFGENPLVSGNLFSFFFIPIFIFFSIKEFKKYYNGGVLHFWQGMSIGFLTYMFLALVSALFILIYLDRINPELLQDYIANRTALIINTKAGLIERLGEATYEQSLKDVQAASAFDLAVDDFLRKILIGFFITTIIAVVMRQKAVTN